MERSTALRSPRPAADGPFQALLDEFRARLDRELDAFLGAKREAAATGTPEALELVEGVARLVGQGGKRLRPALVWAAYRACGGEREAAVLPLALSTELLHTYLLIHDDIMDHAEVRRGEPAAHVRFADAHAARGFRGDAGHFGRSAAILVGDLAHTWAVELFSEAAEGLVDVERRRALRTAFSAMAEEVIAGQYLEIQVGLRPLTRGATEEELLRVLRLKSGRYTAERPIQLGALLAGAPPALLDPLSRYGAAVGEAFQLQDDLLGTFGDAATVGKPVGADLREGKHTFLVHHALRASSPTQRAFLEETLGDPDATLQRLAAVRRLFEETGARARVEEMVDERLRAAAAALEGLPLAPEGQAFLAGLLDWLWERER
ncbi:MAG TPA: polyprenyl synthetase family protein [Thermoanaerobaculia bacterium]|nr:polyprenyl synthetase family protein [Thermoanaerobaculia bacterium]